MKLFEMVLDKTKKNKLDGIFAIGFVKEPGILINAIKLSKEQNLLKLTVDKDQQIVTGPILIPNLKIYRAAGTLDEEESHMYFRSNTIKELAQLAMINSVMNNVTLEHEAKTDQMKLIETWIILNPDNDKAKELGFELPVKTWMASYKVLSDDLWKRTKAGEFNAFSIEGFLTALEKVLKMSADIKPDREEFEDTQATEMFENFIQSLHNEIDN